MEWQGYTRSKLLIKYTKVLASKTRYFKSYLVIMLLNISLLLKNHFLADMGLVQWFFLPACAVQHTLFESRILGCRRDKNHRNTHCVLDIF